MATGSSADLAVIITGADLSRLRELAIQTLTMLQGIRGAADTAIEQTAPRSSPVAKTGVKSAFAPTSVGATRGVSSPRLRNVSHRRSNCRMAIKSPGAGCLRTWNARGGSDAQRPLATVVVGGLLSTLFLTLLALPSLYYLTARKRGKPRDESKDQTAHDELASHR